MSVRQTPVSYLNAQIGQVSALSSSVSTLTGIFDYLSTVTLPEISTSINQLISTSVSTISVVSTAAGAATSSLNTFLSNYSTFSTNQSTVNGQLAVVSTTVSTLISDNVNTSTSISTLTSTVIAIATSALGYSLFSTSFFGPVSPLNPGFSTVYGSNFSTINSTLGYISTIDSQQQSTINTVSTLAGQSASTVNVVSTLAGQSASTVNAQSTLNGEQAITLSNVQISTQVVQSGARPLQVFNGVYTDADWYNGTNAGKTSTIMRFQAGLTADGTGSVGGSNSVSLINNTTASTTMLPLLLGVSGSNIPAYPASANQILRFAHSGVPGTNSSIIINLLTGNSDTSAIEMNAGEVLTMVYAGGEGGITTPGNYYYFPTL